MKSNETKSSWVRSPFARHVFSCGNQLICGSLGCGWSIRNGQSLKQ